MLAASTERTRHLGWVIRGSASLEIRLAIGTKQTSRSRNVRFGVKADIAIEGPNVR
jgi:hypothetical protein